MAGFLAGHFCFGPVDSTRPAMTRMTLPASVSDFAPMRHFTSLAVFLLGAIALIVPSGYSLGAVLLLLGSAWLLVARPGLGLARQDWLVIAALLAYACIGMLEAGWDGQGSRGLDKPVRFALAIPAMLLVIAYPPRLSWLWSGLALGAIGAGSWAGWQKLIEDVVRAGGYTHLIQFGNLSMLMGVLCLAGLGWAYVQPRRLPWLLLLGLGALFGIMGSLFSGSRGGWIGFPLILLVLYRGYGRDLSHYVNAAILSIVLGGALLVYLLPQTGVQPRVQAAFHDVEQYFVHDNPATSVGMRFEMWKGATQLIMEKPLTGWGDNGYRERKQELVSEGVLHHAIMQFGHAHNDFLDAFAKRGLIGLAVLLALYLVPLRLFARQVRAQNYELRSLAVAGVLLPVAYIDFGLSQVFMAHNSGVMMYAFWLAVLWGTFRAQLKAI